MSASFGEVVLTTGSGGTFSMETTAGIAGFSVALNADNVQIASGFLSGGHRPRSGR